MTTMEFDGVDSVCTLERGIERVCMYPSDNLEEIFIQHFWGAGAGYIEPFWWFELLKARSGTEFYEALGFENLFDDEHYQKCNDEKARITR
jgi:hypothetical protein